MRKLTCIALALLALSAASCRRTVLTGPGTIPYVRQVVSDSAGTGIFDRVRFFDPSNVAGSITVIGEPEPCLRLTARLLGGDAFDNVDGRMVEDGLPDFAGEEIAAILDEVNHPYSALLQDGKADDLREAAVRCFLTALDTTVRVSPYDRENLRKKPVAKLIVLSSAALSEYGYADIDTLVSLSGKPVPVLSPAHVMLSQALSVGRPVQIGVWLSQDSSAKAVYDNVFRKLMANRPESAGSELMAFCPPDSLGTLGARFVRLLEMYRDSGTDRKLSVLLLDEYDTDIFDLNAKLAEIRRSETFETMSLSKVLADDFRFIHISDALYAACYRTLRERNLFTHYVAYPRAEIFETVATSPVEDLPFTVIGLNRRFLSEETLQMLDYVQN